MTKPASDPFPPLESLWVQPCGKKTYESRAQAKADAIEIRARNKARHSNADSVPYRCTECEGNPWHLTTGNKSRHNPT